MNKPHIIIKIDSINNKTILTHATFYAPKKKPQRIDLIKLKPILQTANENIYKPLNQHEYIIDSQYIIDKLFSENISKVNKLTKPIAATIALFVALNLGTFNTHNQKDKTENLSKKIKYENQIDEIIPEIENAYSITYLYDQSDNISSEKLLYVNENYKDIVEKYANKFGLDDNLLKAIISQENPYNSINNSNRGAKGITQIESVWWNKTIYAYDFENNTVISETINKDNLDNPEYATKISCMILNNYYHDLYNTYVLNNVLTPTECAIASLTAYNKGITATKKLINTYGNDYINHRNKVNGGDNLYTEKILSYVGNDINISFKHQDYGSTYIKLESNTKPVNKL